MVKNYYVRNNRSNIPLQVILTRLLIVLIIVIVSYAANAQTWDTVGQAGFSAGQCNNISIAIDRSGTPYVVYSDSTNNGNASVVKYNGSSWTVVGRPGFAAATYTSLALDSGGTPYIAYMDFNNSQKATVMKYDGSNWVTVGNAGFSAGYAYFTSIAIDRSGTPYVAYSDGISSFGPATVMKYSGSNWVTVGNAGFSAGTAPGTSIAIDPNGTPYVVYQDSVNGSKATVMKYNGSSWVTVGSAVSDCLATYFSIAIDMNGIPYVAYSPYCYPYKAMVKKYNGIIWVFVGSSGGFSAGQANYTSIALDAGGTPYVVYEDWGDVSHRATVMKYNGSNWINVGNAAFSQDTVRNTHIAIDGNGTPYVVYTDNGNVTGSGKATVMKFGTKVGVENTVDLAVNTLSVYPNPSKGSFTFRIKSVVNENARIIITNIIGQKIKEINAATNKDLEIALDVPPGMYYVTAITEQGRESVKVIVE